MSLQHTLSDAAAAAAAPAAPRTTPGAIERLIKTQISETWSTPISTIMRFEDEYQGYISRPREAYMFESDIAVLNDVLASTPDRTSGLTRFFQMTTSDRLKRSKKAVSRHVDEFMNVNASDEDKKRALAGAEWEAYKAVKYCIGGPKDLRKAMSALKRGDGNASSIAADEQIELSELETVSETANTTTRLLKTYARFHSFRRNCSGKWKADRAFGSVDIINHWHQLAAELLPNDITKSTISLAVPASPSLDDSIGSLVRDSRQMHMLRQVIALGAEVERSNVILVATELLKLAREQDQLRKSGEAYEWDPLVLRDVADRMMNVAIKYNLYKAHKNTCGDTAYALGVRASVWMKSLLVKQ